jgi:hypothetical protein
MCYELPLPVLETMMHLEEGKEEPPYYFSSLTQISKMALTRLHHAAPLWSPSAYLQTYASPCSEGAMNEKHIGIYDGFEASQNTTVAGL